MKKFAKVSTAAFLAGVTTLAVSLPMPAAAKTGANGISQSQPAATREEKD